MKTNQLMKRKMGEFNVTQRTKDGFFCATELLRQWNEYANLNRGNSPYLKQKDLKEFFSNKNTKEFIDALLEEEKLSTKNLAYLKSRGKSGGTWMHPVLFVKFAMWLNPRFEVQVIKFVYDEMIKVPQRSRRCLQQTRLCRFKDRSERLHAPSHAESRRSVELDCVQRA